MRKGAFACGVSPVTAAGSPSYVPISVNCDRNPDALQPALDAAPPGSTIRISGHCMGPFSFDKGLTLIGGAASAQSWRPTPDGNRAGSTLTIGKFAPPPVTARLQNLAVMNGNSSAGGGIENWANLTLKHVVVRHNEASQGGGIWNLTRSTSRRSRPPSGTTTVPSEAASTIRAGRQRGSSRR